MSEDRNWRRWLVSKTPDAKTARTALFLFLSIVLSLLYFAFVIPYVRNSSWDIFWSLIALLVIIYLAYLFVLSLISGISCLELFES